METTHIYQQYYLCFWAYNDQSCLYQGCRPLAGVVAGGPVAKRGVNELLIVLLSWVIIAAGAFVLRRLGPSNERASKFYAPDNLQEIEWCINRKTWLFTDRDERWDKSVRCYLLATGDSASMNNSIPIPWALEVFSSRLKCHRPTH